ncbi:hypothetical protein ABIE64_003562 [Thalassospira sp. MBR-102]
MFKQQVSDADATIEMKKHSRLATEPLINYSAGQIYDTPEFFFTRRKGILFCVVSSRARNIEQSQTSCPHNVQLKNLLVIIRTRAANRRNISIIVHANFSIIRMASGLFYLHVLNQGEQRLQKGIFLISRHILNSVDQIKWPIEFGELGSIYAPTFCQDSVFDRHESVISTAADIYYLVQNMRQRYPVDLGHISTLLKLLLSLSLQLVLLSHPSAICDQSGNYDTYCANQRPCNISQTHRVWRQVYSIDSSNNHQKEKYDQPAQAGSKGVESNKCSPWFIFIHAHYSLNRYCRKNKHILRANAS